MVDKTEVKKLTAGDIRGVFMRSNLFQGSWNFERMQALGFCFCMVPAIRRLYPENNDDRKAAIKRHLEFFNTHPYVAAPVLGVTLAMEEQRANGAPIDDAAINGLKVGLMGPLAGVGDPIFWGTVRPVFAALGANWPKPARNGSGRLPPAPAWTTPAWPAPRASVKPWPPWPSTPTAWRINC